MFYYYYTSRSIAIQEIWIHRVSVYFSKVSFNGMVFYKNQKKSQLKKLIKNYNIINRGLYFYFYPWVSTSCYFCHLYIIKSIC